MALGSLGELVSGIRACRAADQLTDGDFDNLDRLAFRIENGMIRLVESLERKRDSGEWIDTLLIREANATYTVRATEAMEQATE